MAQATKGKLNYRCPSCFMRDIDIDMFFDETKKEYYCLRCSFTGTEADVLRLNEVPGSATAICGCGWWISAKIISPSPSKPTQEVSNDPGY